MARTQIESNAAKILRWEKNGACIRCVSHKIGEKGWNANIYPRMMRGGKRMRIAQWILLRRHQGIAPGFVSRHTCDNPWCINPDHILIGTHHDNALDKVFRNRAGKKLGAEQVKAIRALSGTEYQRDTALRYGISQSTVSEIRRNKIWAHLV